MLWEVGDPEGKYISLLPKQGAGPNVEALLGNPRSGIFYTGGLIFLNEQQALRVRQAVMKDVKPRSQ